MRRRNHPHQLLAPSYEYTSLRCQAPLGRRRCRRHHRLCCSRPQSRKLRPFPGRRHLFLPSYWLEPFLQHPLPRRGLIPHCAPSMSRWETAAPFLSILKRVLEERAKPRGPQSSYLASLMRFVRDFGLRCRTREGLGNKKEKRDRNVSLCCLCLSSAVFFWSQNDQRPQFSFTL